MRLLRLIQSFADAVPIGSRVQQLCVCLYQQSSNGMADFSGMRKPYHGKNNKFDIKDLACREPFGQFKNWFDEACKTGTFEETNAMSLATATKDGVPSVRVVLMKSFDKNGFVFYSNYGSRKSKELEENPRCSLMFYWEPLKKVVRIEGTAERVPAEESDAYFNSRPHASRIGACVSNQSTVIPSRKNLDDKYKELIAKYPDDSTPIPRPEFWGGFRVIPMVFEFWQGQTDRLHDRLRFRKAKNGEAIDKNLTQEADDGWLLERLSP